ncbi:MAG: hypothetical protein ACKOGA_20990 [Planctomycetaceae bacterium]
MKDLRPSSVLFVLYCLGWCGFAYLSLAERWSSPFASSGYGVRSSSGGYGSYGRSTGGSWGGGK